MICEKCGKKVEKYTLSFTHPDKLEPNSVPLINLDEDVPIPGKVLCDECNESKPLKAEDVFKALERVRMCKPKKYTYYIHGAFERSKTGLTARQAAKLISGSIVVIDPVKNRYYLYGKRIRNKNKIKEILKG